MSPLYLFFSHARLPAPSLPPCCIFSFWQPLLGCFWKEYNSTSCWWRCLRVNTPGPSSSTWQDMECPLSLSPSLPQWTIGAMALTECKDKKGGGKQKACSVRGMDDQFGVGGCLLLLNCFWHNAQAVALLHIYTICEKERMGDMV